MRRLYGVGLTVALAAARVALAPGPAAAQPPGPGPTAAQPPGSTAAPPAGYDPLSEVLRRTIEEGSLNGALEVGEGRLQASVMLPRFYERRGFAPAWSRDGHPLPLVDGVLRRLRGAALEGLRPRDYHLAAIEEVLARGGPGSWGAATLADLDLLLTDACLVYSAHLLAGKVDPESLDPQWRADRRQADLAAALETSLATGNPGEALAGFAPLQPGYAALKRALARMRAAAADGGWPAVPEGGALRPGDRDPRVAALRERLVASGEAAAEPAAEPDLYDPVLAAAVEAFQALHGLDADGVVGEKTLVALNVPAEARAQQILVNLERWRWLPTDLGARYLLLNIAGFDLQAVAGEQVELEMPIIVGKSYTKTPVFSGRITYLVLNPYWNVPPKIARGEILPKVQKDPDYLAREGIRVFSDWSPEAAAIDPAEVDWRSLEARGLGYFFRQDPGPKNALGRIKFMFPNEFGVYLHDTPEKALFDRASRTFSHGCIRLSHPLDLAAYLLRGTDGWDRETLVRALDSGEQRTLRLPAPMPVHLLYWTAWVDADGRLELRDDVYGRDEPLGRALAAPPPEGMDPPPSPG
jgi:L,D-transpeptidase YcbB